MPPRKDDERKRRGLESRRFDALLRKALGKEISAADERLLAGEEIEEGDSMDDLIRIAAGREPKPKDD